MISWEKTNPKTKRVYHDHPYDDEGRMMNWKLLLSEFTHTDLRTLAILDNEIRHITCSRGASRAISVHDIDVAGFQYWRLVAMIQHVQNIKGYPFIFLGPTVRYLGNVGILEQSDWTEDARRALIRKGLEAPIIGLGRLYHAIGPKRQIVAAATVCEFAVAHATPGMDSTTIIYA